MNQQYVEQQNSHTGLLIVIVVAIIAIFVLVGIGVWLYIKNKSVSPTGSPTGGNGGSPAPPSDKYYLLPGYNYNKDQARKACKDYNGVLASKQQMLDAKEMQGYEDNYWQWVVDGRGYNACRTTDSGQCFMNRKDITTESYDKKFQAGCYGDLPADLPLCVSGEATNKTLPGQCYKTGSV